MKWVYAPCAGVVRPYTDVFSDKDVPGHCVVIEIRQRKQDKELVVVAPINGRVTEIDASRVVLEPRGTDERHPACQAIETRLTLDDELKPLVELGEAVKAGQVVLRGRATRPGAAIVIVQSPHGKLTCHRLDSVVYTAEPLLAIAREEVDVVEIGPHGQVTDSVRTVETVAVSQEVSPT